MGVLEPSGNGLYLLPHQPKLPTSPSAESSLDAGPCVALTAMCDMQCGTAGLGNLICKACMPNTHTESPLAQH
jgi:hypothetical protein